MQFPCQSHKNGFYGVFLRGMGKKLRVRVIFAWIKPGFYFFETL
jgi:hypothetical protein